MVVAAVFAACADPSASTKVPRATKPVPSAVEPVDTAVAARHRRPLEVYSACADVVTVVFADDPKSPQAGRRTLAPSGSIQGPRDRHGNQTMWLLDRDGEPIAKVRVTSGMKRVAIGKSCRTLDAR